MAGDSVAREAAPRVLLEAKQIKKTYEDDVVLGGCDFSLRAGESVAIMGTSGEGKSTLLSILGMLLTPTSGSLTVDGVAVDGLGDVEASRLRARAFGFVFQHTQLIGSLRLEDNVLVPACFGGAEMGAALDRAADYIERLGLSHRAQHFPHQLSVGQKRRAALARAFVLDPLIIIADEPTNDLDAKSAQDVASALFAYPDAAHALLFATHDADLARRADRILRLSAGRLVPAESV